MLAAASSLFGRTAISQNYLIGEKPPPAPSSTSSTSSTSLPPSALAPPFSVGPWKVQQATHKVTSKRVSVWSCEKRSPEMERIGLPAKERAIEILKAEATSLGRLRHPSILEMVEPLEETRSELIFATEPLLSSLHLAIPDGSRTTPVVELDEIEIQKGVLQLAKGLSFLHTSAKLVHSNLAPWSILINSSGDWKISGLGLTIPLSSPTDGQPTKWEFPSFDARLPPHIQRSFDYMAPEYALDEQITTSYDLYSLGCVIYAVHNKGSPPFRNQGSLSTLRTNLADGMRLTGHERWDPDLRALLNALLTRTTHPRISPTALPTHAFFSSLPISTLNFLERSTFASKPREEKIAFMKGLTGVLDRFSVGLRSRKILPSLLEEMKDSHLLPSILPNVFAISSSLSPTQFASLVLPSLKPLFAVKEPPQNMITLLDNLSLLQSKTEKPVFREHVLPLVYNALESEHAVVQEAALKVVPDLCETIDYAEVQGVMFRRVAVVFTKTRILSVKVNTLVCFLSMVKTLDQISLTQKLVPLLARIKTKEPSVMLATLSVHEAMGLKVDREAVATLVLPQLWQMSMGPLLNVDQFNRFMKVIRGLSERVEKEHNQFLRDSQRIEDRSGASEYGLNGTGGSLNQGVNFESLVAGGSNTASSSKQTTNSSSNAWEDDDWGSILSGALDSPPLAPHPMSLRNTSIVQTQSLPGTPQPFATSSSSTVRATVSRPLGPKIASLGVPTSTSPAMSTPPSIGNSASTFFGGAIPPPPGHNPWTSTSATTLTPTSPILAQSQSQPARPNYNINLGQIRPTTTASLTGNNAFNQPSTFQPMKPNYMSPVGPASFVPSVKTPPMSNLAAGGGILAPSKPANSGNTQHKPSKADWGDFDPLA